MGAWFGFGTAFTQEALPAAEESFVIPEKVDDGIDPSFSLPVRGKKLPSIDMNKVLEAQLRTDEPVIPLAPR